MSEENDNRQKKIDDASEEFSSVIDATSEFLKKIFPHTYSLIDKLNKKKLKGKKED